MKPNRLGWVTGVNLNYSYDSLITADLSIVAQDPGALMKAFDEWMHGGINMPTYQKEFMCLYCGSPNKIESTHCTKCGAPRSFVVG